MSQGSATALDCPDRFDLVLNGFGYMLLESLEPSLPFRSHRAIYGFSPTFVDRQNVNGNYGDDSQAFWLTASQSDWSLGQNQRYLRLNDGVSTSRTWKNTAVNVNTPGQATIALASTSLSQSQAAIASTSLPAVIGSRQHAYAASASLYTVTAAGSVANAGAHGAGTPTQWGMCQDGRYAYIAGASGIQKWDGTSFTSFSGTTSAGALATLDNALYSCDGSSLKTYSTTGAATTVFTWEDNTGAALATSTVKIIPFGGDLLIYFPKLAERPQLWLYDGTSTYVIAELPQSVLGYDVFEMQGVVFLSGMIYDDVAGSTAIGVPIIYYYNNGQIGELWRAPAGSPFGAPSINSWSMPALGTVSGRLIFTDGIGSINQYDVGSGAITSVAPLADTSGNNGQFSSTPLTILHTVNGALGVSDIWPAAGAYAKQGVVASSLIDFESSLVKTFHGIRVEHEAPANTSVDLYYQLDGLDGSYTSLATAVVSGTEYAFPTGTTGRALSYQVRLNTTGATTPRAKRVYVRAAPIQDSFRNVTYILDLSGVGFKDPVDLADGTPHPLSGHEQAVNLTAAIESTAPFQITDRFGTFTALCDPANCNIFDWREGWDNPTSPGGFVAEIVVRQV